MRGVLRYNAPMAKKAATTTTTTTTARGDAQVEFLILSIMSAVVPMIEAKCGEINKRDRGTLQRRIEKAVRSFVAGGAR